jgi:16S rRNA C1402 N4-methylase RsmH
MKMHIPVALDRCIELLTPAIEYSLNKHSSTYVIDATLGLGGHTRALLAKFPNLCVIGIDRDESAIELARENVSPPRTVKFHRYLKNLISLMFQEFFLILGFHRCNSMMELGVLHIHTTHRWICVWIKVLD